MTLEKGLSKQILFLHNRLINKIDFHQNCQSIRYNDDKYDGDYDHDRDDEKDEDDTDVHNDDDSNNEDNVVDDDDGNVDDIDRYNDKI